MESFETITTLIRFQSDPINRKMKNECYSGIVLAKRQIRLYRRTCTLISQIQGNVSSVDISQVTF